MGKGPLKQAVSRYHPEIKLAEVALCTSRKPRFKKWSDPLGIEAEKVLDEFVEILRS